MLAIGYPLIALVQIIDTLLFAYSIVVLAAVVVSWVNADPYNPIVRVLNSLTEPVFSRVRGTLPLIQGVDLSPLVVWIIITFIRTGILPIIANSANSMLQ